MRVSIASLLVGCGVAVCLGGCSVERNSTIYPAQDLAYTPHVPNPRPNVHQVEVGRPLNGLSRSNWRETTVVVPSRRAWARPTYASRVEFADSNARQGPAYPTAQSALQLGGEEDGQYVLEAVVGPFDALGERVLMPFRYVIEQGWYARRPEHEYRKLPSPPERTKSGMQPWDTVQRVEQSSS